MKIRVFIALAAVLSAFSFSFSSNFQMAFDEAKAVFVGEVVGEENDSDTRIFDFKIEKHLKSANAGRVRLSVYETARFQAWFKKGGKYLIYATAGTDGKLHVSRCSRSRDAEDAEEDLQKLGEGKSPR